MRVVGVALLDDVMTDETIVFVNGAGSSSPEFPPNCAAKLEFLTVVEDIFGGPLLAMIPFLSCIIILVELVDVGVGRMMTLALLVFEKRFLATVLGVLFVGVVGLAGATVPEFICLICAAE